MNPVKLLELRGKTEYSTNDLADFFAPDVREIDPEAERPAGYWRFDNSLLVPNDTPPVDRLIQRVPRQYRELLRFLQWKGEQEGSILIPKGLEDILLFSLLTYDSNPVVFGTANVLVAMSKQAGGDTLSWTKPNLPLRWAGFVLIGPGGGGGGGARVTTSTNDAAGGGGGGGGGYIARVVALSTLSSGNLTSGTVPSGGNGASTANSNGNDGSGVSSAATFAGLSAAPGTSGGGGTQGAGAQTGAAGTGGAGDISGSNGGTGRSGATVGSDGVDQASGPAGAGGGGGGGANADASQANAGRGGHSWATGAGGGAAGTTASRPGAAATDTSGGGGAGRARMRAILLLVLARTATPLPSTRAVLTLARAVAVAGDEQGRLRQRLVTVDVVAMVAQVLAW